MTPMHRARARKAFTFIELTITVLVIGILTAVAVPAYVESLARFRTDLAARQVAADLRYARSEALRTSQDRTVNFLTAVNQYTLSNVADINDSTANYLVNLADEPYFTTLVSANLGGDGSVVFDRFGRPDTEGTIVVQSGSVQQTINLAIDGSTSLP